MTLTLLILNAVNAAKPLNPDDTCTTISITITSLKLPVIIIIVIITTFHKTQNNPRTADVPSVALTKQKRFKFPSELFNGERWITEA